MGAIAGRYNYTDEECLDNKLIITPRAFIEPAYCCGNKIEVDETNSTVLGGENAALQEIGLEKNDKRDAASSSSSSSKTDSSAEKDKKDDKEFFVPPPYKNVEGSRAAGCASLTHEQCSSMAQVWYTTTPRVSLVLPP